MFEPKVQTELSIDDVHVKKAALVYRAINHEMRMEILRLLHRNSEMIVTDLYTTLCIEQSVASQHLAILRKPGIVTTRKDGKNVYYSVNQERLNELHTIAQKLNG
ncbi:MAG: helix-turn-helix transcriptional regulator [Chitinophagaceae bacterium]|nr:helix-turn-helix transcriptional regulator [Chitinophagaceae bacterium]